MKVDKFDADLGVDDGSNETVCHFWLSKANVQQFNINRSNPSSVLDDLVAIQLSLLDGFMVRIDDPFFEDHVFRVENSALRWIHCQTEYQELFSRQQVLPILEGSDFIQFIDFNPFLKGNRRTVLELEALRVYGPSNLSLNVLEISPGSSPMAKVNKFFGNVTYCDIKDWSDKSLSNYFKSHPVDLDFVLDEISISDFSRLNHIKFDMVVSCHVLEHIPDPILHLKNVLFSLRSGGVYVVYVPNSAYTFDLLQDPSMPYEAMVANEQSWKIFPEDVKRRSLSKFVDPETVKQFSLGLISPDSLFPTRPEVEVDRLMSVTDDFHGWFFFENSLYAFMSCIARESGFVLEKIYSCDFEFCIVFKKA